MCLLNLKESTKSERTWSQFFSATSGKSQKAEWPREERTCYLFIVNMTLKWHEKCHSAPLRLFYFDCSIALLQCNFYYYMDRDELQHRPIGSDNVPSLPSFFITKCIRQGKKKNVVRALAVIVYFSRMNAGACRPQQWICNLRPIYCLQHPASCYVVTRRLSSASSSSAHHNTRSREAAGRKG